MSKIPAWRMPRTSGTHVIKAQQRWLQQVAGAIGEHMHESSPQPIVDQALTLLLSGLLQSAVSVEVACQHLGDAAGKTLVETHNERCLTIAALLQRNDHGEPVAAELLGHLHAWSQAAIAA